MERMLMPTSGKAGYTLAKPVISHTGIKCDSCGKMPITGPRFKCANCTDYDLCETCNARSDSLHNSSHVFVKLKRVLPQNPGQALLDKNLYDLEDCVPLPPVDYTD